MSEQRHTDAAEPAAGSNQDPAAERSPDSGDSPAADGPPEVGEAVGSGESDGIDEQRGGEAETEVEPEDELTRISRERDEYLELAQRARADFENFRRRSDGQARDAEQRGKASVAKQIAPALDNLERALTAAGVDPSGAVPEGEPPSREVSAQTALAEGVALVYRDLRGALERAGVVSFDPLGEKFDPSLHEAIATGQDADADKGVVIETLEKGYRIEAHVLRPARVIVNG